MPRPARPRPASHRLRHVAALALSGSALAALVYVETVSAQEDRDEADEVAELAAELDASVDDLDDDGPTLAAASIPFAAPRPASPPAALAVVTAEAATADASTKTELAAQAPEVAMIAMPDLKGMSLTRARRSLAKLGLKISARDGYGYKIERDWYDGYKVRSQDIEAGTPVQAGTRVKVKARERYHAVSGY